MGVPHCSLLPAVRDPTGGPIFVAGGTVVIGGTGMDAHSNFGSINLSIHGGYNPTDWSRDPTSHPTILDISASPGYALQLSVDRLILEHVRFEGSEPTFGVIGLWSYSDETFMQDVTWQADAAIAFNVHEQTTIRDSEFHATSNSTLVSQGTGDLVVLRSRFEHTPTGSGGNSITINGDSALIAHSEFISSHGASGMQPTLLARDADVNLLNNSFLVSWPFPGSGNTAVLHTQGTFTDRTVTLINNARRAEDGGIPRFYHESSATTDFIPIVVRNNILTSGPGTNAFWAWRWPSGLQPEQFQVAEDWAGCANCIDVTGNQDVAPGFFDPDTNDLRVGAGSAMIDSGLDLTAVYQDWAALETSRNGQSRPQGGAWDIGAHELND